MTIKLKSKKVDISVPEITPDHQVMVEAYRSSIDLQRSLGLGSPEPPRKISVSKKGQFISQMAALNKEFRCVSIPPNDQILNFTNQVVGSGNRRRVTRTITVSATTTTATKTIAAYEPPKLILAQLNQYLKGVEYSIDFRARKDGWSIRSKQWIADLPIMPASALEAAAKAKRIAPDGKFFLLWEAVWKVARVVRPQGDPVLLMKIGGEFFEIAKWGGDQDLVNEFVLSKEGKL